MVDHYHLCDEACPNGLTAGALTPSAEEVRAAVYAQLRNNLGSLTGTPVGRPHYGGQHLMYRRSQVEAWLDEQEELIEKEERRG
jgi:hypothetical protein